MRMALSSMTAPSTGCARTACLSLRAAPSASSLCGATLRKARLPYEEMLRLGLGPTATQLLSTFFPDDPEERLFVAGVRSKTYDRWLDAFAQLRRAGLAH